MQRAIAAARRAFDETDWSTNRALRKRASPAAGGARSEQEELREELIAEVGVPRMMTYGRPARRAARSGLRYPAKLIDEFEWERDLG